MILLFEAAEILNWKKCAKNSTTALRCRHQNFDNSEKVAWNSAHIHEYQAKRFAEWKQAKLSR